MSSTFKNRKFNFSNADSVSLLKTGQLDFQQSENQSQVCSPKIRISSQKLCNDAFSEKHILERVGTFETPSESLGTSSEILIGSSSEMLTGIRVKPKNVRIWTKLKGNVKLHYKQKGLLNNIKASRV